MSLRTLLSFIHKTYNEHVDFDVVTEKWIYRF